MTAALGGEGDERVVEEVADLWFHTMVLLGRARHSAAPRLRRSWRAATATRPDTEGHVSRPTPCARRSPVAPRRCSQGCATATGADRGRHVPLGQGLSRDAAGPRAGRWRPASGPTSSPARGRRAAAACSPTRPASGRESARGRSTCSRGTSDLRAHAAATCWRTSAARWTAARRPTRWSRGRWRTARPVTVEALRGARATAASTTSSTSRRRARPSTAGRPAFQALRRELHAGASAVIATRDLRYHLRETAMWYGGLGLLSTPQVARNLALPPKYFWLVAREIEIIGRALARGRAHRRALHRHGAGAAERGEHGALRRRELRGPGGGAGDPPRAGAGAHRHPGGRQGGLRHHRRARAR